MIPFERSWWQLIFQGVVQFWQVCYLLLFCQVFTIIPDCFLYKWATICPWCNKIYKLAIKGDCLYCHAQHISPPHHAANFVQTSTWDWNHSNRTWLGLYEERRNSNPSVPDLKPLWSKYILLDVSMHCRHRSSQIMTVTNILHILQAQVDYLRAVRLVGAWYVLLLE